MSRMKSLKRSMLLAAACSALVSGGRATAAPVFAGDTTFRDLLSEGVAFHSTLNGASEVPATDSAATGTVEGRLTGTPGRYVFKFGLSYDGITSDLLDGHVHYGIDPPGGDPRTQEGPVVYRFPDLDEPVSATWSWDDERFPLTDSLVDSLFDGELYINLHSSDYPDGEVRGQLGREHQPPVSAVPLPAPLAIGAAGLGLVALAKRRRLGLGR